MDGRGLDQKMVRGVPFEGKRKMGLGGVHRASYRETHFGMSRCSIYGRHF